MACCEWLSIKMLWISRQISIYCTDCTTDPQQIEIVEFGPKHFVLDSTPTWRLYSKPMIVLFTCRLRYLHCITTISYIVLLDSPKTRKLSYRKDDRAMRPIYTYMYGCPKNFRKFLITSTIRT